MNLLSLAKTNTDEEMQFLEDKRLKFESNLAIVQLTVENVFGQEPYAEALINILSSRRNLGVLRCEELKALNTYIELRLLSPLTEGYADAIKEAIEHNDFGYYKKHVDAMEKSHQRSMDWHSVALDFRQDVLPSLAKTLWPFLDQGWQTIKNDASGDGTGGMTIASNDTSSSTSSASPASPSSSMMEMTMKVESSSSFSDDDDDEAEFEDEL